MSSHNVADTKPQSALWPLWWRIGFRFSLLYWFLYIIPAMGQPSIFSLIPFGGLGNLLSEWFAWPLGQLARVVGFYVFHLNLNPEIGT